MSDHPLGDAPIEAKYIEQMNAVARGIDKIFNPEYVPGVSAVDSRDVGFVLLVFPFGSHDGRCNYISNGANRKDIAVMFREQAARFEGQPDVKGHA